MIFDLFPLPAEISVALLLVDLAIRVVALVFVPRGRLPSSGLAWLLAIFFLPVLGGIAYLVIGRSTLPQRRQREQSRTAQRLVEGCPGLESVVVDRPEAAWLAPVVHMMHAVGSTPLLGGNRVRLVLGFEEQLQTLVEALDAAHQSAYVQFYTFSKGSSTTPFFDALARAARRGVQVKVLADHLGSARYPGWGATTEALEAAGVDWHLMLPVQPLRGRYQRPDLRNHRKIVVVDHEVALVGSLNLIDPGYQKRSNRRKGLRWQDSLFQVRGPAVAGIEAVFATDWCSETGSAPATAARLPAPVGDDLVQVVPSGPGLDQQAVLRLVLSLLGNARHRVAITTPYLVPDEALLHAITSASLRGVDVELFTGAIADQGLVMHAQRSYYATLLEAGVRIWLYPAPTVLHAKHLTVDEDITMLGSANMDIRSFHLDLEVTLLVNGEGVTTAVRASEDERRRASRELTPEEWRTRSWPQKVLDDTARLTSAL